MMEFHPVADIFPLMHPEALAELTDDIRQNGLLTPITRFEGKILDGRNRAKACEAAGVKPKYVDFKGSDPLAFVIAMNLKRRMLDESQRAMVAARIANLTSPGRPSRKGSVEPISKGAAAKRMDVGRSSVTKARKVLATGTKALIRAVEEGMIAVDLAAKLADQDEAIQTEAIANPDKAVHILKQKTREGHEAALAHQIRALPNKRYGVILADPPWKFLPWNEETGSDRSAANHYALSRLQEIKSRDLPSISADDCVLFLWATVPMLPHALEVMEAWGFDYKSNFVWLKDKAGTGYWSRNVHEHLLIGTRGHPPAPAPGTQFESAWDAPVAAHSEKPEDAYEIIEAYFPNLPKIELDARDKRDGWDRHGAEAPVDLEAAAT